MTNFARRRTTLLLVLAGGIGAGCGKVTEVVPDSGATGGASAGTGGAAAGTGGAAMDAAQEMPPPLTTDQACADQADTLCSRVEACASFMLRAIYGDKATCIARSKLGCLMDQSVPGTTRTADDIAACTRDGTTTSCADILASRFPATCNVKPGTRVNGMGCGSDWQCQSTYCKKSGDCGLCAARADAGGACTADDGCVPGLVCAASKCVRPIDTNAACDDANPCRSDLYCQVAAPRTCMPKVGAAASCADTDKACDLTQGVGCNPFTKVCDRLGVASGGDACGLVSGTLTICVGLNPCPGLNLFSWMGVCANPADDGEACGNAANGLNCIPPATCDPGGLCRLPSVLSCN